MKKKRIIITGGTGQLGQEVYLTFQNQSSYEIISFDKKNLDITDFYQVRSCIQSLQPCIVINCGAYTNVSEAERNVYEAYRVNCIGAKNIAIATYEIGATMLHISTDYVFHGKINSEGIYPSPFTEFDTPNPQTVYGKSKLQGEVLVQSLNPRHIIIRTSWLYGKTNNQNFIYKLMKQIAQNDTIHVVDDQISTPTSTKELVMLMIHLLKNEQYGLYHGSCEGQCSRFEYAQAIFSNLGINKPIFSIKTSILPAHLQRPQYTVLENYMLLLSSEYKMRYWKDALKIYLKELNL